MPSDVNTVAIDRYWASFLGCSPDDFGRSGVHVVAHGSLAGYWGMWAFRLGDACILSVPPEHVEVMRARAAAFSPASIFDATTLAGIAPAAVERVLGVCYVGYAEAVRSPSRQSPSASQIADPRNNPHIAGLIAACGADWEVGGVDVGAGQPIFGCFGKEELVAAASYEIWGERLAHICVVTAPGSRSRGFGKSVSGAAASAALDRGLIPQWRTLESNAPSLAIAKSLGFEQLASHCTVRFASRFARESAQS